MSASNTAESLMLNWLLNASAVTRPTAWFVALFNGDPGEAGSGGTEVTTTIKSAGGRPAVAFTTSTGGGAVSNSAAVDFGNAAGAVASVTHFGIYDASSAGNLLLSGTLTGQPLSISAGQPVNFPIGALTASQD